MGITPHTIVSQWKEKVGLFIIKHPIISQPVKLQPRFPTQAEFPIHQSMESLNSLTGRGISTLKATFYCGHWEYVTFGLMAHVPRMAALCPHLLILTVHASDPFHMSIKGSTPLLLQGWVSLQHVSSIIIMHKQALLGQELPNVLQFLHFIYKLNNQKVKGGRSPALPRTHTQTTKIPEHSMIS